MPETELVVVLRGLQGRYSAAYVGLHDLHAGLGGLVFLTPSTVLEKW